MQSAYTEKQISFVNHREERLFGVLHLPPVLHPPVIVMAHGFTDDKTGDNRLFVKFGRYAAKQGIAVLRFDFAGSGDSEGDFRDISIKNEVQDLLAAIDFLRGLDQVNREAIYALGYSLGGAIAIEAAAIDPRIKGLVLWAPAIFLRRVFGRVLGRKIFSSLRSEKYIAAANGAKQFLINSIFLKDLGRYDLVRQARYILGRKIFLAHGTLDKKVLTLESKRFFEAIPGQKDLHLITGAGHAFAYFEKELFKYTLSAVKRF